MSKSISTVCLSLGAIAIASWGQIVHAIPLRPVSPEQVKHIGLDQKLVNQELSSNRHTINHTINQCRIDSNCSDIQSNLKIAPAWNENQRQALQKAIDHSLYYLSTPKAAQTYLQYGNSDFNLERVRRSLVRFQELLLTTDSPTSLSQAVKQEFVFYQSVGKDQQGKVEFTGYFEPTYTASRVRTEDYRYPLYRKPENFDRWSAPHPTRAQLEGKDGLGANKSVLKGQELVWLRDRLEAFLIQVQGSARLNLTDGSTMTVGYGGTTNYPYVSIGKELVEDGLFSLDELSLPKVLDYFSTHPQKLDQYIPRNKRFVFFRETNGKPPTGNLGVPVTGDRSIATDKSLMPPGALALIVAPIPEGDTTEEIKTQLVSRYVLDQDTGSAIKGPGRVDLFLGSGEIAGERAGRLNGSGSLFYLLLKE